MSKKLLELAAEIVQAQASIAEMSSEEIESALTRTFNALLRMHLAEQQGKSLEVDSAPEHPVVEAEKAEKTDNRSSIKEDSVTCLECGEQFRQLTANHLRTHGMTPRDYKRKYGFPLKQPLAAKNLTKMRSKSAKKRGLPEKLKEYHDAQRRRKLAAAKTVARTDASARNPAKKKT